MSLAQWILERLTPGGATSKERLVEAMKRNAMETELLTGEIHRVSFKPDKTTRLRIASQRKEAR
jgi:hypothetical protein